MLGDAGSVGQIGYKWGHNKKKCSHVLGRGFKKEKYIEKNRNVCPGNEGGRLWS